MFGKLRLGAQTGADMYDIIIIGAGITGCFIAREMSRYQCKIAVVDAENDVANGATMANSAIVHAGYDPEEGSLKARFNVRGSRMYEEVCRELGTEYIRTSAYVAACSAEEVEKLEELYQNAVRRGIPVAYVSTEEARKEEPALSDHVVKVMELPTTAIIYPWETATALMEEAVINGCDLFLANKVTSIIKDNGGYQVKTNRQMFVGKLVINAAGVYADQIYQMAAGEKVFTITARKGEYYVLDRSDNPLVKRVIYPIPSASGKGVLAVPTTHGNVLLGPNSVFTDDKEGNDTTREGLDYVRNQLMKTLRVFPANKVIRSFAGLRASGEQHDFIIEESDICEGFFNVACIESPGLASAPAIAEYVVNELILPKYPWSVKESFKRREPMLRVNKMTPEEQNELVRMNPAYGRIVCRCEQVTEAEIVEAIRRPVGATTVKGVKKRVRPGMGRCQGGFCEPLVVEILARELGITPQEVLLDSEKSLLLTGETKEVGGEQG